MDKTTPSLYSRELKRVTTNTTIIDGVTNKTNNRYISESWKRIITNVIVIVNALTKL